MYHNVGQCQEASSNKMKKKTELLENRISVRLSAATLEKLSNLAESKGMTASSLARFWLEERIKKETK